MYANSTQFVFGRKAGRKTRDDMNDLTVQITAEDWRSQNAISNLAQYVKRSASAFAQGYDGEEVIIADGICYKKSDPAQKAVFKNVEGRYVVENGEPAPSEEEGDVDTDNQTRDSMHSTSTDGPSVTAEDAEKRGD